MSDSISDNSLLRHLAERDEEAAQRIFDRYSRRLCQLAEQHLHQKLASRLDGEDVVQSVFRTFFQRSARGEFQVDPSGGLWCLLVTITLNKVRRQARWHQAEKRNVSREAALNSEDWTEEMLARDPGQVEALILVDRMEHILQGQPPEHAEILSLRLEGVSRTEIGRRLKLSRQTVHRVLNALQKRMQLLNDEVDSFV